MYTYLLYGVNSTDTKILQWNRMADVKYKLKDERVNINKYVKADLLPESNF